MLFDRFGLREAARVCPKPNRLLVFMHSSVAFHGVDVVTCPASEKRMSYHMDYYASKENSSIAYARYQNNPTSRGLRSWTHGTIFVLFRPLGEFRFPDLSTIKRVRGEVGYVLHCIKYLLGRLLSKSALG